MLRVLIADDERIERKYLRTILEKHPDLCQVAGEAANGKEVLELTAKIMPDVIIMDINMPLTDGLSAAHRIRENCPHTVIILNTAYAEFEFAKRALDDQLNAYLLKPASEEQIIETIRKCTAGKSRQEPASAAPDAGNAAELKCVLDYINENYSRVLTLDELAAHSHFSSSYLSKLFHQVMGMTLTSYITQVRIRHAVEQLEKSENSIRKIAEDCGYANVSHFNRVFKKQTGLTPQELRHKAAQKQVVS